jgi:predicted alpha/beta hydrolase
MTAPAFGSTTQFPSTSDPAPDCAVLLLPALATPAYAYKHVVKTLNHANIHVAVMHYGPHGVVTDAQDASRPSTGFNHLAQNAIPRAMHELTLCCAGKPIWVLGHSLGAQIAVLAVKLGIIDPAGLYFVAGGTPYYRCFPGLSKITVLAGTALTCAVSAALGHWPGQALRIGANESADLVRDWAMLAWTGSYDRLPGHRTKLPDPSALSTYDKPLVATVFADDDFAPRPAVEALCHHLPQARLSVLELDTGGHMGWLKDPGAALADITQRHRAPRT